MGLPLTPVYDGLLTKQKEIENMSKSIKQLEQEAKQAREVAAMALSEVLPYGSGSGIADKLILAAVAMVTYQFALGMQEVSGDGSGEALPEFTQDEYSLSIGKMVVGKVTDLEFFPDTLPEVSQEDTEVIALMKEALKEIERNTCSHEETHRGGAIWEICDICGCKWADDEGGKPEFVELKIVTDLRNYIEKSKAISQEERDSDGWIDWGGGDCPVGYNEYVSVKNRDGSICKEWNAGDLRWEYAGKNAMLNPAYDIIAYRIVK